MDTLLVLQMCAIQQIGKLAKEMNKMAQKWLKKIKHYKLDVFLKLKQYTHWLRENVKYYCHFLLNSNMLSG